MLQNSSKTLQFMDQISWETVEFMRRLFQTADDIKRETSEGLFAALGGVLGVIGGYAMSLDMKGVSFELAGPLGGALGILLGTMIRRGPRRFALEWSLQSREIEDQAKTKQAETLLGQLRSLPAEAPYEVREEIWTAYRNIVRELAQPPRGRAASS